MAKEKIAREELLAAYFEEISRQSTWTVMFHQAVSVRMGLNPTDVKCAGVLRETGPITAGELAELTGLTTGAITGVIDRLEKAGFVRRVADPHDRRRVIVELVVPTPQGTDVFSPFQFLQEATQQLLAHYTDEELALILDYTRRGAQLMKEQTARLRELGPPVRKPATA